jgi:hypothetical protein
VWRNTGESEGTEMAKKYQKRPDDVAARAWSRGYLTPLDLFKVAAWKTGQGLGSLTVNTGEEIEARTQAAVNCIQPWRDRPVSGLAGDAMWEDWRETARRAIGASADRSGLLGLEGVGYPMATAVLDILDPDVWPVMDRWAVITVFGTRPGGQPLPGTWWQHATAYEAYARHLVTHGAAAWGSGLSVHELDEEAMNLSRTGRPLPVGWNHAPLPPRA